MTTYCAEFKHFWVNQNWKERVFWTHFFMDVTLKKYENYISRNCELALQYGACLKQVPLSGCTRIKTALYGGAYNSNFGHTSDLSPGAFIGRLTPKVSIEA